jgi:hypothetical protein
MYAVLISVLLQVNNPPPVPGMQDQESRFVREMMLRRMEEQRQHPQKSIEQQWVEKEAAVQQTLFVNRFNNLLKKLRTFIDGYNAGKVDVKAVEDVQKAWNQVQKDGWFKKDAARQAVAEPVVTSCEESAIEAGTEP